MNVPVMYWYHFRLSSSPVLVDTHVRSTMPRNMHVNGNEWSCEDPSTPPPPPPPHGSALALHGSSHGNSLSATLPVKKKSVTIGTFTTVVEPFEIDHSNHHHDSHVNESMMTSAVWQSPKRVVDNELEAATRFNGSDSESGEDVWQKKALKIAL